MILKLKPRAVVRRVDDVGVLGQFQIPNCVGNATYFRIDMFDYALVCILGIGIINIIWHVKRDVRH